MVPEKNFFQQGMMLNLPCDDSHLDILYPHKTLERTVK